MAKGNEKRFNKKSRTQNIETEISDNQAVVENTVDGYGTEGASNALVIQKKKVFKIYSVYKSWYFIMYDR